MEMKSIRIHVQILLKEFAPGVSNSCCPSYEPLTPGYVSIVKITSMTQNVYIYIY